MSDSTPDPIYRQRFTIPTQALDQNGHVNNVHYLQWMQDIAVQHYESLGGRAYTEAIGATWVVRAHRIEYLRPAFAGEEIEVRTWVVNLRRVRSLRRYAFYRVADGLLLVKGETDWVFVDLKSGRPVAIPTEVSSILPLSPDE